MRKFLRWLLGFRVGDDSLKTEIDKCKDKYGKLMISEKKRGFKSTVRLRYLLAKEIFKPAQRKLDGFKSCDGIYDRSGNLVGWRLNNYFWKRPEVRRQLEASKRWRK